MDLLGALVPEMGGDDVEACFAFVASLSDALLQVRSDVMSLLCDVAASAPALLEHMHRVGASDHPISYRF
jgi:hypothetical protein